MKVANIRLAGTLYLASVLVIHAVILWNVRGLIGKGYPDFTIYYTAGSMVRQGMGHMLYDDAAQFQVQRQFAPDVATRLDALPFNHPPFEAVFFVPFTYFSYSTAYLLWAVANLAMLATLPRLLRPYVPLLAKWPALAWAAINLCFFPIFFALLQGQDAILLLFFYGLAFVSLKRGRFMSAGAWLACGLFKFHLVLPFLCLLLIQQKGMRSRAGLLIGFLSVAAGLGLISVAAVGAQAMISYPHYVLGLEAIMAKGAIMPSDMPNLRGVLYLLASDVRNLDRVVIFLSGGLFLVAAWASRAADDHDADLRFSLMALATFLVSYHGLGYDLCLLALPALLLISWLESRSGPGGWARLSIIAGLAILLFSPLQLVLLMRYNRLALTGWAVLLCFAGVAGALRMRTQPA